VSVKAVDFLATGGMSNDQLPAWFEIGPECPQGQEFIRQMGDEAQADDPVELAGGFKLFDISARENKVRGAVFFSGDLEHFF